VVGEAVMDEMVDARDVPPHALSTGMHRSEIASIKWEHLDVAGRTLSLPKAKNGNALQLPMSDFAWL
jgi:integrase